jgi:hypothetical protein
MATTMEWAYQPFATTPMTGAFESPFRRWTAPFTITGITLLKLPRQ